MDKYTDKMTNHLKRADGQLQGILRMMEEKKGCPEVVTQLSAVRASLDSLIGVIVAESLKSCLLADEDGREDKIDQAIKMIVKK